MLNRIFLTLVAGLSMLVVTPPSPALAVGTCVAAEVQGSAYWGPTYSVVLYRNRSCQYYTRLTIDDAVRSIGMKITFKVERQKNLPTVGPKIIATQQRTIRGGGAGTWETGKVEGGPTNLVDDKHRVCYRQHDNDPFQCKPWQNI